MPVYKLIMLKPNRLTFIGLLLALPILVLQARAVESDAAMRGLIDRIAPGHSNDFTLETIAAPGDQNIFEVEAQAGKIVLRGDGPLSQAVAFNWYLKHEAHVAVSWYADDPIHRSQTFAVAD